MSQQPGREPFGQLSDFDLSFTSANSPETAIAPIDETFANLKLEISAALQNALSLEEFKSRPNVLRTPRQGFLQVQTLEALRKALELSKPLLDGLTDEWIDRQIEHEGQHIEAAKRLYGPDVPHSYGVQYLMGPDGRQGLVATYQVRPRGVFDPNIAQLHDQIIREAPDHLSEHDKSMLASEGPTFMTDDVNESL